MQVKELPVSDRPATRLANLGAQSLTVQELLALVVGGNNGLAVAGSIIGEINGDLTRLPKTSFKTFEKCEGIGEVQALRLAAAVELGRRSAHAGRPDGAPARSPKDVVDYMMPRMDTLEVEEFHILILDAQHRMKRDVCVTRGLLNSSLVHPREVFQQAITEHAAAIVLVHNHPSGDPSPSSDDRQVTEQLVAAGRLLDIPVHDHVIIGNGRYLSFAESGLL